MLSIRKNKKSLYTKRFPQILSLAKEQIAEFIWVILYKEQKKKYVYF